MNLNILYASIIVEELCRNKIYFFCISPGSRSTPLAYAIAQNKKAKSIVSYDERGSAYFALGVASQIQKPVVLVGTSGTAIANYYPAIIEAYYSHIPLLVLSADRPGYLQDMGANQTIDQISLFGKYCRSYLDLPAGPSQKSLQYLPSRISNTVSDAKKYHTPVHINCRFDTPLIDNTVTSTNIKKQIQSLLPKWFSNKSPYVKTYTSNYALEEHLEDTVKELSKNQHLCVIVGRIEHPQDVENIIQFIQAIKPCYLYTDILSHLKFFKFQNQICNFKVLQKKLKKVDTILHIGGRLVTRYYESWLQTVQYNTYINLTPYTSATEVAPIVLKRITGDLSYSLKYFRENLLRQTSCEQNIHATKYRHENLLFDKAQKKMQKSKQINSLYVVQTLIKMLPNASHLFTSNSMSIRLLDIGILNKSAKIVYTWGNRGASGIDGNIASAIGIGYHIQKPLFVIIGDTTFLHDINSLSMLHYIKHPICFILLNDQNGSIFSFLSNSYFNRIQKILSPYTNAPHTLEFQGIAQNFNLQYKKIYLLKEWDTIIKKLNLKKHTLLEIKLDHSFNQEIIKTLF